LFVRDRNLPDKYHPRFEAQKTHVYESLKDADKSAFDHLYNDYFYHRNTSFWYRTAMKRLQPLVQSTSMLVCADDFGETEECMSWALKDLHILSTELPLMTVKSKSNFGYLQTTPYLSVCSTSEHITQTLRQWWDDDPQRTQDYCDTVLRYTGHAPHPLPGWVARDIVSRQLSCRSVLCILPLQDWMAMDERLRCADPAVEGVCDTLKGDACWHWRMHTTIKNMMAEGGFNDNIRGLIARSGRQIAE